MKKKATKQANAGQTGPVTDDPGASGVPHVPHEAPADDAEWVSWFVARAKELRRDSDAMERRFLEHLREGERRESAWRSRAITFDRFLRDNDICAPERYRNGVATLDLIGDETEVIGMLAAKKAACIVDEKVRTAVVSEMVRKAVELEVPLSNQTASRIVSKYLPSAPRKPTELEALRKKVRRLEKELVEKDQTIAALRKQLGEQEKQAS